MMLFLSWVLFPIFLPAIVVADPSIDQTLSPYFFVKTDDPEAEEQLPLKSTSAEVDVAGVIADVKVTQVYQNTGTTPIEAVYVFPASTRAAVHGMRMTIGERVREAVVQERKQARATYNKAKKEGKSASLLKQHRPNVFQMNVANIMPGDEIKVELFYTELLVPTDGVYEFIYPTVVGPRYSNQKQSATPSSERWVQNPYLTEGEPAPYAFDLNVRLASGIPLQDVTSTSHQVKIVYDDESRATIRMAPSEKQGGNRDFILKYRLEGGQIESGLLLHEGDDENFFLLMMQPPQRVTSESIPPREYVFVVDVSGSMNGFPLNVSKKLMKNLLGGLRETDKFNVLLFAGGSSLFSQHSVPANPENIRNAIYFIERQRGGGGTELLPALKDALDLASDEQYSRTIVIVTDGYVHADTDAIDLIRNNLGNANVFAFGIGSSVNRYLIEGLARAGYGEPFVITKPTEAPQIANRFREYIETPVLTDIDVNFGSFDAYDIEPPSVPDVLAERPVIVFGKWKGKPKGTIQLHGLSGNQEYSQAIDVAKTHLLDETDALQYLWARHRIQLLSDYNQFKQNDERIQEITNLGLTYNLLTKYTSFVAVDDVVRNETGKATKVKQPLPLPKGVSNLAVGGIPTVPEPETYAMLGILGLFGLWLVARRRELVQ